MRGQRLRPGQAILRVSVLMVVGSQELRADLGRGAEERKGKRQRSDLWCLNLQMKWKGQNWMEEEGKMCSRAQLWRECCSLSWVCVYNTPAHLWGGRGGILVQPQPREGVSAYRDNLGWHLVLGGGAFALRPTLSVA